MSLYEVYKMNNCINRALFVGLFCFVTSVFIINWAPDVPTSHASSPLPEKNSTLSNSSAGDIENAPITTIIIPNQGPNFSANSNNIDSINVTEQGDLQSNSLSSNETSSELVDNQFALVSPNDTTKTNVSSDVTNNDTSVDPQQRGKYLTDDNGIHYYNINNCSEKRGSSGIGDMSECEDAAKEMSEE
jgi:hypothetical protein